MIVEPELNAQKSPDALSVMTLSSAPSSGLRRFVVVGSTFTKSPTDGLDDVKRYSGVMRVAQSAWKHRLGGNDPYGSPPGGGGSEPPARPQRSPATGRRPNPWKSATRERRRSVPSTACSDTSSTTGMRRTLTGARFVAGSRLAA